jgi:Ca2+/H+ antiporter
MQRNSYLAGELVGVIAPGFAYIISTYTTLQQSLFSDKPIAFYVIAAVINLIIVRFSFRAGQDKFAKGIVLITFLAMLVLIFATKLKVG